MTTTDSTAADDPPKKAVGFSNEGVVEQNGGSGERVVAEVTMNFEEPVPV